MLGNADQYFDWIVGGIVLKKYLKNYLKRWLKIFPRLYKCTEKALFYKRNYSFIKCMKNREKSPAIIYFGVPNHTNLGDQAQTYCTFIWLNENFPNRKIYSYHSGQVAFGIVSYLKKYVLSDDLIFIQSGYNTTDLYMAEEKMHREVIQAFPENRIVIMPQTVFFENISEQKHTEKIYNSHKKLIFFARDNVSYKKAKEMFPCIHVSLYPDIVTSLIGNRHYSNQRNGILLCVRNDKESAISKSEVLRLKKELNSLGYDVSITDTTIDIDLEYLNGHRDDVLEKIFDEYSNYELVITDRYHGTIFSLIAATPVFVLATTDHKLSSGVDWFPDSFDGYISYKETISQVLEAVREKTFEKTIYSLPPYFSEKYYKHLLGLLNEVWDNENM